MQQTLLIFFIEVLLAILIALIVLLILNWRRKYRCQIALEQLVEDVKERQSQRGEKMVSRLVAKYRLDDQAARELAEAFFAAEKIFISQFVEQQIQESIDGFYENLCALLDSYLKAMPVVGVKARPAEEIVTPQPDKVPETQEAELEIGDDPESDLIQDD